MRHSPEKMGRFLYTLTGPPILQRVVAVFGGEIK